jgi:hypothetical protein
LSLLSSNLTISQFFGLLDHYYLKEDSKEQEPDQEKGSQRQILANLKVLLSIYIATRKDLHYNCGHENKESGQG